MYFLPLRQEQASFRPIVATKYIIVATARDVSEMFVDDLRARWEQARSDRGSCPRCGSEHVWFNGIRLRKASLFDGETVSYVANVPARRLKCGVCRARWSRAPDRVPSRAHYQPCVVSRAVAEVVLGDDGTLSSAAREYDCHRRTLGRWVERVSSVAEPATLAREIVSEAGAPVLPAPPVKTMTTSSVRMRAFGARAVWILALLDALASLRGLEPPGLAHVDVLVPAVARPHTATGDPTSLG